MVLLYTLHGLVLVGEVAVQSTVARSLGVLGRACCTSLI